MLKLSLVTPSKKILFDQPVDEVFVPAARGELNILTGHSPLVSTLSTGLVKYRLQGEKELNSVIVSWGFLEVLDNNVSILAETAERPEEVDVERAKAALAKATEKILAADLEQHQFQKYQLKVQRATIRMQQASTKTSP